MIRDTEETEIKKYHDIPEEKETDHETGYNYIPKTEDIEEGRPVEIIKTDTKK